MRSESKPGAAMIAAGILLTLLIPAFGIAIQNGIVPLSFEGSVLLLNYLEGVRPLPAMIFDPLTNDWGLYQAREMSYLVDYFDAQFIRLSAKLGIVHLLSLNYYLCVIGIILLIHCVWRRLFDGLSHLTVTLCGILLLASPFFFLGGTFFRSSKMLCSLMLALICAATFLLLRGGHSSLKNTFLVLAISASSLFMCLLDRQGVFFSLLLCVGLGLYALSMAFRKRSLSEIGTGKSLAFLILSLFGVILFAALYNRILAPLAIFHLNGYWPDFSFQRMDFKDIFNFSGGVPFLFGGMGIMACDSGMLGGFALALLIGLGLLAPLLTTTGGGWREWLGNPRMLWPAIAYVFVLGGMLVSANMMAAKHPEILWPDVIRGVYFCPDAVVLLFFLFSALDLTSKSFRGNWRLRLLPPLLALFTLGNVLALPNALEKLRRGNLVIELECMPEAVFLIRNPSRDCHISFLSYLHLDLIKALREGKGREK